MPTIRPLPRRSPDIKRLITTLRNGKPDRVPNVELGVSPVIKAHLLGRQLDDLQDEIEFWYRAEYDYVKLQPGADFNPGKVGALKNVTVMKEGVERKWASESTGVIGSREDLDRYRFPSAGDFDYSRFDRVRRTPPGRDGGHRAVRGYFHHDLGDDGFRALFSPDL